jgi:biotin carboxyl carrier protein
VKYDVEVNGKRRQLTVERRDGRVCVASGDRSWIVDLVPAGANTLSLVMQQVTPEPETAGDDCRGPGGGFSRTCRVETHEIVVANDAATGQSALLIRGLPIAAGLTARRRWGARDDSPSGAGPQRIVAPMPGKVVRVLSRPGEPVEPRQAVVVIEAMKMENELRAARAGTVTELLVREGQSVEAGALLAVVTPADRGAGL